MSLCSIEWVVFCCSHYFDVETVQIWPMRAVFSWILSSFDVSPSFFAPLLTFWHKMFQAPFVLSLPQPGNQHFTNSGFFLVEDGIEKARFQPRWRRR